MNKYYLCLIFIFLIGMGYLAAQRSSFNDYSFIMPCEPTLEVDSITLRKITIHKCNDGDRFYVLKVTDYYNGMYSSDSLNNIEFDLRYTQRNFLKENKVKMWNLIPKSLKGYPGKEFRYEYLYEDKIHFTRVFIVKNRVIQLSFFSTKVDAYNDDIDLYFDSFRVNNLENNSNPYLNLPSDEEIKNKPFEADFFGETELRIEVHENFAGRIPVIMEGNEIDNKDESGIIMLAVAYSIFQDTITESQKKQLIQDQQNMYTNSYQNGKLNNVRNLENGGVEMIASYELAGSRCIDQRRLLFENEKYYLVWALRLEKYSESEKVESFFRSFRIK